MQKTINTLVQLQELVLARAQQEASMPGTRLKQLETSIESLSSELPDDVRSRFERIVKKDQIGVAPMVNKVCTACGMSLPTSLAQVVRLGEVIQACPNCARILYYQDSRPKNIKERVRSRGLKAGIERFSSVELMMPHAKFKTRDEALEAICAQLEEKSFVDDGGKLYEEALLREAIVSTAVGHGMAFPHVRCVEGGGLTLALATCKKGVKFDGPGKTLTRLIFFMVIPTAASAFYLKLLSGLTQVFQNEENRKKLLEAADPEELWKALIKTTKSTIQ